MHSTYFSLIYGWVLEPFLEKERMSAVAFSSFQSPFHIHAFEDLIRIGRKATRPCAPKTKSDYSCPSSLFSHFPLKATPQSPPYLPIPISLSSLRRRRIRPVFLRQPPIPEGKMGARRQPPPRIERERAVCPPSSLRRPTASQGLDGSFSSSFDPFESSSDHPPLTRASPPRSPPHPFPSMAFHQGVFHTILPCDRNRKQKQLSTEHWHCLRAGKAPPPASE